MDKDNEVSEASDTAEPTQAQGEDPAEEEGDRDRPAPRSESEEVDEASEDSFPTSDPPSW
jgi:hypothetical protein